MRKIIALMLCALLFAPNVKAQFNYAEALQKSLFFYEAQQSGELPDWNRVSWRDDSALGDGSDVGHDLTGGWYDAGDHVKFGFPMAYSVTALAWGGIVYEGAYRNSGQLDELKRNLRFVTDYFLKCHTAPTEFYGQLGNGGADHAFWGSPEVMVMDRPAYKIDAANPGSDLAGETAAALAAVSILLADDDPSYSATLLDHAIQLYDFADTYRGVYSESISDAAGFYRSFSGYNDELAWGAAWLYRATNDAAYLTKAEAAYQNLGNEGQSSDKTYKWGLAWDDKSYGIYVLMSELTGDAEYMADAERHLDFWTSGYNGERVAYSPGGQAHLTQWGSLRHSSNTAFLAFVYSDKVSGVSAANKTKYHDFAVRQINYALGDNPINRSFMIGFGNNPAYNPHHRSAHGAWANNLRNNPEDPSHILYGALVGGPSSPNDQFVDDRGDFIANEVACDYNACFTGALARMYDEFGGTPLSNFPVIETPNRSEIRTVAKFNSNNASGSTILVRAQNRTAWPARVTDQLSYRYYFDISEGIDAGYTIDDYTFQLNGTGSIEVKNAGGSVYYADVTNLPSISPIGDPAFRTETQINIRVANGVPYDVSNDWSAQGLSSPSQPEESPNIPLYENGELVFGNEPAGADVPNAAIAVSTVSGDVPLTVSFDGSGSSDPNGDALSYAWDFGDNNTGTGATIDHTYTAIGTYTATLTVGDGNGNTDSETVIITVTEPNLAPEAAFSVSVTSGDVPLTVDFDASASSDTNGDVLSYLWDFGDGTTRTGISPTHTFVTPGTFVVTLTVSDGRGGSDLASDTIEVIAVPNDPPTAIISVSSSSGETPFVVTFDGTGSTDPNNDVLSYSWDFGDGNTGSGATVSHTYTSAGSFTATLTVIDGKGGLDSDSVTITIEQGSCSLLTLFGVPRADGLPTTSRIYENVHVLGNGPDMSNVRDLTINWANESWGNAMHQLSSQTLDGMPDWWNDLREVSTNTFEQANPSITFTNSGFPGLDETYYVNIDGENLVFVETSGLYALYFSNSGSPPAACTGRVSNELNTNPVLKVSLSGLQVFPNPTNSVFTINLNTVKAQEATLFNVLGQEVQVIRMNESKDGIVSFGSGLKDGIYYLRFTSGDVNEVIKLIKK